ncbi:hypothetical protein AAHA92_16108 [Salvia divinorum]|uniref:Uncharacterized protein n=1 Tax=Salvia divinorum TaxID=28513 RepID=A0ABD1GUH6_SALDI
MSTCILSLKTLTPHTTLKSAPLRRRRYCHATTASPPPTQHLQMLGQSLLPNVVVLESHFTPPTTKYEIDHSPRLGTGFFLHPTLIATSIHAVACLSPSLRAQIARTLAFTHRGAVMLTTPLALDFARGIALLQVVEQSEETPPACSRGCKLTDSPPQKDSVLLAVARHQSLGLAMMVGNVRGERSVGAKAPWPLDDGAGWIEHGWFGVGIGDPEPGRCGELREVSVARIMGSPLFNMEGEVVGVASWEVKDEADRFSVGFAAPASSLRAVAEYVKTKGREDPIVMDSWVDGHVFYGEGHC